jgi:hypothetical protein
MSGATFELLNAVVTEPGALSQSLLRQSGRQAALSQQISKPRN